MENVMSFEVKENSIHEFADKYLVDPQRPQDTGRKEPINPYYILGRQEIYIRKEIMDVIQNDSVIKFELADESRNNRTRLVNIYQYSIEKYDDVLLKLELIDFKIEIAK